MRIDRLTTKFQQALGDAQSLALSHDCGFIEPQHLLLALLSQDDGGSASLLQRAGVNVASLRKALAEAVDRLPKLEGQGGEISISRDLNNLLNLTDKEATRRGDQYIASELFVLAAAQDKGETGRLLKQHGASARPSTPRSRRCAAGRRWRIPRPRRAARRSRNTRSTSPSAPARASSIR